MKKNFIIFTIIAYLFTSVTAFADNYSELVSAATSGFGQITQQASGTYGSLMHNQNTSTPYHNNYPNNMNGNYYPSPQQTPMYQGTYSSLSRNNLMNSRFIKR